MALSIPGDEIIGRWKDEKGLVIREITGQKKDIPVDPQNNIAAIAAQSLLDHIGESDKGLELRIHKHIPAGSGIGTSAASAVAATMLVNEMLNRPFDKRSLLRFALEGESIASGSWHGDNVVPCMMGGLILVRDINTFDYQRIYTPAGICFAIVLPSMSINTRKVRDLLRPDVPLKDMVIQAANLASFVVGMQNSDLDLIGRSLQDVVIEPQRKHLIPHFDKVKETALQMGALGCSISGAGSAIFAMCSEKYLASEIALAMQQVYEKEGMASTHYTCTIDNEGARLM